MKDFNSIFAISPKYTKPLMHICIHLPPCPHVHTL